MYNVWCMIRKQIYLTPDLDRELDILARSQGQTVAETTRQLLRSALKLKKQPRNPSAFLLELAANATKGGPRDLSANLFEYLYGDKSPNYGKKKTVHRR